jgi:phosphatidylserine/phosphatidylglycerophosphate/cardiolipin synthase-like enzyme
MVIDESTVVAGSFNYTEPANDYNDENLFVIGTPYQTLPTKEGGPVDPAECTKIANYFGAEIDRIIAASDPYQP